MSLIQHFCPLWKDIGIQVELTSTLSEVRKTIVHYGVDDKCSDIITSINQKLMPTLGFKSLVVIISKVILV